ncbi:hypothetical protein SPRG_20109 [Saprolegnia parasitica CBS 223.65]|uniref:Hexose transporter 1 n=1 Tax=Saprolegnia parasitica (strain CBS 223.65) TaxID=695850 RepID=A0A067CER6_SAPPC|nr:hypothetical protein SPRG_20109 [Saprolegnia parasitica CBS 223.65]KDO29003.1 hypothetical protein SPRG_20109 [Saprolegnia parasitica CBS 223.65]|eukprot:XP_012200332.1 hypothetical protein SPRG_20109 [Saprolegnia parasitica CBS 223.65]
MTLSFGDAATPLPSPNDTYVAIEGTPKHAPAPLSVRAKHRSTSRIRLSRLEGMLHEEHAKALVPTPLLYVTIAVALMGSFQFGWLLSQLNYRPFNVDCMKVPIPDKACILFPGHSERQWTMAVTAWIVGGAIGACGSGYPADQIGRHYTLLVNAIIMILGSALQTGVGSITLFSFGRLVSGIASGAAINVSNVLISEISPTQMRGMFSTGLQVGVAFGSLAVTTVHYFVGYGDGWRVLVGFPIVLGIAQILLIPLTTKSPVWLVTHGETTLALAELQHLYRPCDYEATLQGIIAAHDDEVKETAGVNRWSLLFSEKYRKQLTIAIVLCSAQQLCGINAVMYYSSSIFFSAGVTDPRVGNTIVNVVRTTMILVAARIMDKFKRRTLLLLFMTLMAIASVGIVVSLFYISPALSVASTGLFVGAFCLSIGPMAWMVSAEIFPDFLHAGAGGVGTMCTWLANLVVGVFYPMLADPSALGSYTFLLFVGYLLCVIGFVYSVVPETAQQTFDEIQATFARTSPRPDSSKNKLLSAIDDEDTI